LDKFNGGLASHQRRGDKGQYYTGYEAPDNSAHRWGNARECHSIFMITGWAGFVKVHKTRELTA
jgi:hypothetical protein